MNFGRFFRMTGQTHASGRVKCDLLLQCCKTKYLEKQVKQIVTKSATFADVLVALERQYSKKKCFSNALRRTLVVLEMP